MAIGFILGASAATVAAVLVTGARVVGVKRLIKHATLVDVTFTVGMAVAFAGTLTGLLVAIMAGLMMAVLLSGLQYLSRFADKFQRKQDPASEFTADGQWIYNQAPYV